MAQDKKTRRRSPRLRGLQALQQQDKPLLPSPTASAPRSRKRRRVTPDRDEANSPHSIQGHHSPDPIVVWAQTSHWPPFATTKMSPASVSPSSSPSARLSKVSKTSSGTSSHFTLSIEHLAAEGAQVYPCDGKLVNFGSRKRIKEYYKGEAIPTICPSFSVESFDTVLMESKIHNEFRLQRDITPLIIPSARLLIIEGHLEENHLIEDLDQEWSQVDTFGGKKPKPDITVGFRSAAFTWEERTKLQAYATMDTPTLVTPLVYFPFLMCEVKAARGNREEAEVQNSRSGAIAVRAVFELLKAAYGKDDKAVTRLYGQILVWSIYHDTNHVVLNGHFLKESKDPLREVDFFRFEFGVFQLRDPKQRFIAYNFVRNLYAKYVQFHFTRIRNAIAQLSVESMPAKMKEPQANSSAGASEHQGSELLVGQVHELMNQVKEMRESNEKSQESHRKEIKEQKDRMEQMEQERIEAHRKEMKEQRDRMEQMEQERMEAHRKEMKEQRDRMEQMEQERKEEARQIEQERKEEREEARQLRAQLMELLERGRLSDKK